RAASRLVSRGVFMKGDDSRILFRNGKGGRGATTCLLPTSWGGGPRPQGVVEGAARWSVIVSSKTEAAETPLHRFAVPLSQRGRRLAPVPGVEVVAERLEAAFGDGGAHGGGQGLIEGDVVPAQQDLAQDFIQSDKMM